MKLWVVTISGRYGIRAVDVVRAATAEDARALSRPWPDDTATVEPLPADGEPGVIVSDSR